MKFRHLAFLVAGLVFATACSAQTADGPWQEGTQYQKIDTPQRAGKDGKVEVVEVFSYGCPHCGHYEAAAEDLQKQLPPGVVFRLVPAAFNTAWEPYARAFYAARELGVLKTTHAALFKAKYVDNYPINTMDEIADFYARNGVDKAKFLAAANSAQTTRAMQADMKLIQGWGVEGTPTLVVNGKYRSDKVKDYNDLNAMTLWLAKRELAGAVH